MRRCERGTTARPDGCHRATEQGEDRSDRTYCPRLRRGGSTCRCQMRATSSNSEERREPGSDATSPLAARVAEGVQPGLPRTTPRA
eukprot:2420772-Pyramimonas_sp.AAC.1